MKSTASRLLRVVGGLMLLGTVGLGLLFWQFNRPPFDIAKLQLLQAGMSQQQVRQILGDPRRSDATSWQYARAMAWPIVRVHFDASGRLLSHEYDY